MKCQKCGSEEVTYYTSTNINGEVTETALCADCAQEEGASERAIFGTLRDAMSPSIMSLLGERFMSGMLVLPALFAERPRRVSSVTFAPSTEEKSETATASQPEIAVDETLNRRRELNVLHEQMRVAAAREDFETAAELRDEIKKLEARE
ncbi:MAG: UvrB/UvrC motif-containing protein [Oscillospiraceae bacterium]|jgi:protein-arginine kinase activator protein McsA|nr:UvrB/UvrC motif-containing protein [Oscillospiraceae bacterium]